MNVKVDEAELRRIYERLEEITIQLQRITNQDNDSLSAIGNNVRSTEVQGTIKNYTESNAQNTYNTINYIGELKAYLNKKISEYKAIDTNAQEFLSNVQSHLNQNEGL